MSVQDHRSLSGVVLKDIPEVKVNFASYSHIRVVNNRVMVKEITVDYEKSAGGIVTAAPTSKKKEFTQGVVVAVGEGFTNADGTHIPTNYTVGDVVYFGDMAGIDFKLRRANGEFEKVKVVDVSSIYFVDGEAADMYTAVTP